MQYFHSCFYPAGPGAIVHGTQDECPISPSECMCRGGCGTAMSCPCNGSSRKASFNQCATSAVVHALQAAGVGPQVSEGSASLTSLSATMGVRSGLLDSSPSTGDALRQHRRTSHSALPTGAFTKYNLSLKVHTSRVEICVHTWYWRCSRCSFCYRHWQFQSRQKCCGVSSLLYIPDSV